ncbi:MAG: TrmB family transcriptional regulator [Methanomassiliicoccales archaeon]|nr:TrmB family transcriptional regulator [Methanomassiliicoccales archaeon]NYT16028.1 TrmB family transcriptional regulator [Methanomassiliicoccales archaeon]
MSRKRMDFEFTHLACDEDANRILSLACHRDVSIKEISDMLNIPMSRCYRRVNDMVEKGMLRIENIDENRASLYRSNLKSFYITFENESLNLMVEFQDGGVRSFSYNIEPAAVFA